MGKNAELRTGAISWEEFYRDVQSLVKRMGSYRPDVIVPCMRGGLIPAAIIAELMDLQDIRPISVERKGEERTIAYDIIGDIRGLRVLLIEDALPTGKGPHIVKLLFQERKAAEVKIATVYATPQSAHVTDFYTKVYDRLPDLPWKPSRVGNRIVSRIKK